MDKLELSRSLISAEWLYRNLANESIVLLDATIPKVGAGVQEKTEEIMGIPGARFFDLKGTFRDLKHEMPNTLPDPGYFQQEVRKLGINKNSCVIVYDKIGMYSSPRVWWLFKVMGHKNVGVLNGGLPNWVNIGYPVTPLKTYQDATGDFTSDFNEELVVKLESVLANITSKECQVLDARSSGRFNATEPEPRAGLAGGHIPNSQSLPHSQIVKNGIMVSEEELKRIFADLNKESKPMVFSCGSGITACILALAAEQAGFTNFSVYDGSWTEWASSDMPIET